ncbi:MAG: hypothetical protein RQ763_00080 [Sulfurimonas sp.]|uniref:hypothetical protein n=1 Tax=Sulfurimonas sp. TaxID=2022749 RepID=UPI0028CC4B1F|nr:hypothetical protein [Sulfurimonas sp.]MDT8337570.1 hypothetical protein [Sulfurimonas sp.]
MSWNSGDTSMTIQGLGALAGAWGQYETGKEANKIKKEQLAYEKQKDDAYNAKIDKAQTNLDDAFSDSIFNVNNKKKKNPYDYDYEVDAVEPATAV